MRLADLAERLGGRLEGSGADSTVTGVSTIQSAVSTEVCYYGNSAYELALRETAALAVIASSPVRTSSPNLIIVRNPYLAFREALLLFGPEEPPVAEGIHPAAVIHPSARLSEGVSVGPGAVVEAGCLLGEGTEVGACAVIGRDCVLGKGCVIHPGAVLYRRSVLGDRVAVHSGTVIGADGFGFVPNPGGHLKVPQTGNVEIGDDVEIGAGCTLDRAVVGSTRVGRGTKLDNLVQIAHNVTIGADCLIAAQTGIAGSTRLGDGVVCGGQAGIGGHLVIGDRAVVAAQSGVTRNVPAGMTVSGYPARRHEDSLRMSAALADLPGFRRRVLEFLRGAGGTEKDC